MFPNVSRGISLIRVLSGINKSLSIAREIIPIYEQVSPMIGNARKAFSILKEFNTPNKPANLQKPHLETNKSLPKTPASNYVNNAPSFFL